MPFGCRRTRQILNIGALFMRKSIISLALALGLAFPVLADTLTLRPDAPARYVVVRGDTLWGISGRYLKSPWRWPELWRMNRDEVRNPHLIYPGEVLVLSWVNGRPQLSLEGGQRVVKLSPRIRIEDADSAVPSIPAKVIEPFIKRPLVVSEAEFARSPRIIAGPDDRVILSQGDRLYAQGLDEGGVWQAYRMNKPLTDPDTKEVLGYEVVYGGDVRLEKEGEVQTLRVERVAEEIAVGDRLVKAPRALFVHYAPHPVDESVRGKIISTYNGVSGAAQYYNVVINRGAQQGVEVGHVFGVFKRGPDVEVTGSDGKKKKVSLPTEQGGKLFIYRVFDKVAYGLVMESQVPLNVGDEVAAPVDE
ncbi:LysM domain [Gulbenkiania indica]|uniref:LysM domain n=2 Tax=Chromobacteriaceae TaxID=1499392 RepID=A0A0K6GY93_9NEIS|nr:LysM domain [Gulbenkiania indica]